MAQGEVRKIEWPVSKNGRVHVEVRWEVRRPWQIAIADSVSLPTFDTRGEAAAYLRSL